MPKSVREGLTVITSILGPTGFRLELSAGGKHPYHLTAHHPGLTVPARTVLTTSDDPRNLKYLACWARRQVRSTGDSK